MNSYYKRVVEYAKKFRKEGKIETAINFYEEAGEANEMYVREALELSLRKGLVKRGIDIFKDHNRKKMAKIFEEAINKKSERLHSEFLDSDERNYVLENSLDVSPELKRSLEDNIEDNLIKSEKNLKGINKNKMRKYLNKFHNQN